MPRSPWGSSERRRWQCFTEATGARLRSPSRDRFQVFRVQSSQALIYGESFLAVHRTDGIVVVQVTFNVGRTTEQKVALYRRAAQLLAEKGRSQS